MDETHQPLPEARQPLIQRMLAEWKTLAILGGPILIAQVAQMANGVIDTVMAGHASAEDLAAVGIGSSLWMPLFLFFMGMLGAFTIRDMHKAEVIAAPSIKTEGKHYQLGMD